MSNFVKSPLNKVDGKCINKYTDIIKELESTNFKVLTIECYPGVNDEVVLKQIENIENTILINTYDIFKSEEEINEQIKYFLTEDRVFGKMYYGNVIDFMDFNKLEEAKKLVKNNNKVIIYGFGASLVDKGDILTYVDLSRWEIQLRYRKGMGNFKCSNYNGDKLRKFKRGYFFEWRIADKLKASLFNDIDYMIDGNKDNEPKMITGDTFRNAMFEVAGRPFRTQPYFDAGVWGGHWMEEKLALKNGNPNYAWSFDGVPEENSLLLEIDGNVVEFPAMDIILSQPIRLLGPQIYSRFGAEFPIRFDFLDTIGGQNLSLQVHPVTEYIKKEFGMTYTQDESYYMLDANEDACVYLGLKEGVDKEEMIAALHESEKTGEFDAEKYVNKFPAKKHDHFLIPAGTIHCSGSGAMVLEISATPYIFTFKLYDWNRVGIDGKPRPININHGEKVIQWDRTTNWVKDNLVNNIDILKDNGYLLEHTGLHELEFIETRRYTTTKKIELDINNNFCQCNLVDGQSAIIESLENKFEPYVVHYAETFILPASIGKFSIKPGEDTKEIKVIQAYVRVPQA
jgi:mannose-6-phosphate isomerase class I